MEIDRRIDFGMLRTSFPETHQNGRRIPRPGDLSQFTANGEGFYGYYDGKSDPIKEAPITDSEGGVLYFGNSISRNDFQTLIRILGVNDADLNYNVYIQKSRFPKSERYLTQMRLISDFALKYLFIDSQEADTQTLSMSEAMWAFMEKEKDRYGTMFGNPAIAGTLGGDGNYAQEELAFGIAVENSYNHVYRLWSRPWLVTK